MLLILAENFPVDSVLILTDSGLTRAVTIRCPCWFSEPAEIENILFRTSTPPLTITAGISFITPTNLATMEFLGDE
jgi:hypothetical protein